MSSSQLARRGVLTALTVLATAVFCSLSFGLASANAADTTTGTAQFSIGVGKGGKVLIKNGVKVKKVGPAKLSRKGKRSVVKLPVTKLETGARSDATLKGGFVLKKGKRAIRIKPLNLAVLKSGNVGIGGTIQKLGGKKSAAKPVNVFNVAGKAKVSKSGNKTTLRVNNRKVSFTAAVIGTIRNHLRLNKAPKGQIANLNVTAVLTTDEPVDPCVANPDAEGCPIVDPYMAQCNVAATSKVTGSLPVAAALPTLSDPKVIAGPTTVPWGVKTSFRNYVTNTAGPGAANGSIHAVDGATTTGSAPAYSGFEWTFVSGQYSENGTPYDFSDDQVVVNLDGTAVFCATGHNFRIAVSDPTIVIDGEDSRIIASVDSNLDGVWAPSQRVDLATMDLSGVNVEALTQTQGARWSSIPAEFTNTGGQAFCGVTDPKCQYGGGSPTVDVMDPITVDAPAGALVDQYNTPCAVSAASRSVDSWTPADGLPTLTDPLSADGSPAISWGYKDSFRSYVSRIPPPGGSIQGLSGATHNSSLDPGTHMVPPLPLGFSFPTSGGQYAANDPADNSDDQAIINGSGTGLFCKSGHFFWTSISDPTIVIDGENSRIVATLSQNVNGGGDPAGPWQTPQRVDLAELDLSGITPVYNKSGSEVTWTNIPVTQLVPFSTYSAGTALDPITVTVKTPYDTGAGDAAAWDALASHVETNLPFPNPSPTNGGCEVGVPAGGSAAAARTIDEHASYGGTTAAWMPSPDPAADVPAVTGTAVNGGGLDWGFRASLRSSVSGSGQFNLAEGATASTDYYGHGGSLVTFGGYGMNMGAASSYFTWPTSSGTYNANGVGDTDDQLVLRTEGVVGFCQLQSAQRYGIIFSNPTVVIDGANSRLTYDVATRYRLSWIRATVDFADLDVSQAILGSDTASGTVTKTWSFPSAAVTLTADGNKMARMLASAYVEGLALDGATIRASFPE